MGRRSNFSKGNENGEFKETRSKFLLKKKYGCESKTCAILQFVSVSFLNLSLARILYTSVE